MRKEEHMKKIILVIVFLLSVLNSGVIYGAETNEILEEQEETLGVSGFIKQAQKYTNEAFDEIDISTLYKNALTGNINANGITKAIFKVLSSEVTKTIVSLGYILVIIILHSIIKSISEGMGNKQISEITYYVQYILIVTLIMTNFSEMIVLIKETINNLVRFYKLSFTNTLSFNDNNWKYCYCIYCATTFIINYNIYRKFYNFNFITINFNWDSFRNCFKNF